MLPFIIFAFLSTSFSISCAKKETCDLHAAVGIHLTLPFTYEKLSNTEKLVWLHNHSAIYQRDKGKVTLGKADDVLSSGSLVVTNPKMSSAGVYQAQVYNATGFLTTSWSSFICVMDKVLKPKLSYACDPNSVTFNCDAVKVQDLRYSWKMDDKPLPAEERSTLTVALSKLKAKSSFVCSVSNQVSYDKSDAVLPICTNQPSSSSNQLCLKPKVALALLAGTLVVVLLLVCVIIVMCCQWRRTKTPKRRDKEEPQMLSLSQRKPEADYETMHAPEKFQEPSLELSPQAGGDGKGASVSGGEGLQISAQTGAHDPSPVPKPRTRRPNTPDI